ncbi:MAG: alpha/beta fold hydrolase [Burkholderiales bacterium]
MLFLHSTPDELRFWMFQTAHFSAWYRTIAVDLAGYGRSPATQPGLKLDDQAQACWELIDRITSDGIIIQGNSIGASVAMHMANQRPRRTLALIVSGTGYSVNADIMWRWVERYRNEGLGLRHPQVLDHFSPAGQKSELARYYADMVASLNNEGTLGSIIAMNEANARSRPRPEAFYDALTMPVMIIAGKEDRTYPSSVELHKRLPGSKFAAIEGAGHACNFEAPWEFDRHCIAFLDTLGLYPGPALKK